MELKENSLYSDQAGYDNLIKDREKIADALLFNFFGFISLFAAMPKRDVREWKKNEGRLRLEKIDDTNTDVSLSVKLAYDAHMLNRSIVDKLTRLLSLFKQGIIAKPEDINDDLIHELFMLCKFDTMNKPSQKLRPIVDQYVNRDINITFLARGLYKYSKLNDYKDVSTEFFNMYRNGAYNQVYSALEKGQKQSALGVPIQNIKAVTDKTNLHVKAPKTDQSGLAQVVDAVHHANDKKDDLVTKVKNDIEKTITGHESPVQVVEPEVKISKKFNPHEDKTVNDVDDKYGLKSLSTEKLSTENKLIKAGFNFDNALSSQEQFVEEYKNSVLNINVENGVIESINQYYNIIYNYLSENDLTKPDFIVDKSELKPKSYYKSGKDQGTYQALFVIHLSYLFADIAVNDKETYRIDDLYPIFKKISGEKSIIGGNKQAKDNTYNLIEKYAAKINFKDVISQLLKYKTIDYNMTLFKYMFVKYIFDILLVDGEYTLDQRLWFAKELNKTTKETVLTNIVEFYDQFDSNLIEENKVYIDSNTYTYQLVLVMDPDVEEYVVPLVSGMVYAKMASLYDFVKFKPPISALIFIASKLDYLKSYDAEDLNKSIMFKDSDALKAYSLAIMGNVQTEIKNVNKLLKPVLEDIAVKSDSSIYYEDQTDNSDALLDIINSKFIDYSIIKSETIEAIRKNLFNILKLYKVENIINALKRKDFVKNNINLFEENKTLFELNFKSDLEQAISQIGGSSRYLPTLSVINSFIKDLNTYGSGYDMSYYTDFLNENMKSFIEDNSYNNVIDSISAYDNTGDLFDILMDQASNIPGAKDEIIRLTRDNAMASIIGHDKFIETAQKHPEIFDDFNLDIRNEDIISINGIKVKATSSPNYSKFIQYYTDTIIFPEIGSKLQPKTLFGYMDPYQSLLSDIILHGWVNPVNYVEEEPLSISDTSNIQIMDDIRNGIEDKRLNKTLLDILFIKSNPTKYDIKLIDKITGVADSSEDDENSFIQYMQNVNSIIYDKLYEDDTLANINKYPDNLKKKVVGNAIRESYEDVITNRIDDVRSVIDSTPFDLLVDVVNDETLSKLAKINSIGLQSFHEVDLSKYETKEDFNADIENVLSKTIELDIQNTQVMPIESITDDKEFMLQDNIELYNTSNGLHGNVAPIITKVYTVNMDRTKFDEFVEADKLNPRSESKGEIRTMMIHGTGSVATAFISKFGFREIPQGMGLYTTGKMLGPGIYLAENVDKSLSYIGDSGFMKAYKEGYIYLVDTCLGEYGVNFLDGRNHSNLVSPEWCVKDFEKQIVVKKIYKVQSVSLQDYKKHIEN